MAAIVPVDRVALVRGCVDAARETGSDGVAGCGNAARHSGGELASGDGGVARADHRRRTAEEAPLAFPLTASSGGAPSIILRAGGSLVRRCR